MPYSVSRSFRVFQTRSVDLAPEDLERISAAAAYLHTQVGAQTSLLGESLPLHGGFVAGGALARSTAIRPLGQVELLWLLSAEEALPVAQAGQQVRVGVARQALLLGQPAVTEECTLSAREVLAAAVSLLARVPGSQAVCTEPDGRAVTLELAGYPWVFRVTPRLCCGPAAGPALHPEPGGHWCAEQAADLFGQLPDLDRHHNHLLLPLIRLVKYWNANYHSIPGLPATYLEALLAEHFGLQPPLICLKQGLLSAFLHLGERLGLPQGDQAPDGRPIAGETRAQMGEKALVMAQFIQHALYYEQQGDQEEAIGWWRLLFFPDFPAYHDD